MSTRTVPAWVHCWLAAGMVLASGCATYRRTSEYFTPQGAIAGQETGKTIAVISHGFTDEHYSPHPQWLAEAEEAGKMNDGAFFGKLMLLCIPGMPFVSCRDDLRWWAIRTEMDEILAKDIDAMGLFKTTSVKDRPSAKRFLLGPDESAEMDKMLAKGGDPALAFQTMKQKTQSSTLGFISSPEDYFIEWKCKPTWNRHVTFYGLSIVGLTLVTSGLLPESYGSLTTKLRVTISDKNSLLGERTFSATLPITEREPSRMNTLQKRFAETYAKMSPSVRQFVIDTIHSQSSPTKSGKK